MLKQQLTAKVDTVTSGFVTKFQTYHKSVDGLLGRAEELLKRLDADNRASMMQTNNVDPLTRDIELMRIKRDSAMKAEEILTKIKSDVDRERLLPRFQEFTRILSTELPIYDDMTAGVNYKTLAKEFENNIQTKPDLKQLLIVRDPYATNRPLETGSNPLLPNQYHHII